MHLLLVKVWKKMRMTEYRYNSSNLKAAAPSDRLPGISATSPSSPPSSSTLRGTPEPQDFGNLGKANEESLTEDENLSTTGADARLQKQSLLERDATIAEPKRSFLQGAGPEGRAGEKARQWTMHVPFEHMSP
jgi:hypothetical protein